MIDSSHIAREVLNIIARMHELRQPSFIPSEAALSCVIEQVFWASMDQYEGTPLRTRLFFAPTIPGDGIIRLSQPYPLSRDAIRSLSPAHSNDGALLVEADLEGGLLIHAVLCSLSSVREAFPHWLSVVSRGPGCVTVCISSEPIYEFTRGTSKLLAGMSLDRIAAEVLLMSAKLFPNEPNGLKWHIASMLLDVGQAIDRHGTGGAVWILPSGTFMDGDLSDLGYNVEVGPMFWEPFREMWEMRTSTITIDGAIVVNGAPQLLAFGVICNRFSIRSNEVFRLNDPSDLSKGERVDVSEFGGSRHRSAIDFCANHSPAGAVVASHDGGVTVFASKDTGVVFGSRVSPIASDAIASI